MLLVATLVMASAWLLSRLPKSRQRASRAPSARADAAAAVYPDRPSPTEPALRDVLDASRQLSIVATDVNGLVTMFTKGAEALLGYTCDEVVGKLAATAFHDPEELAARAQQAGVQSSFDLFRALPNLGLADEREWTYVTKAGRKLPVWLQVTSLMDATGKVTGYLGMARDISHDKAAKRDRDGFFAVCQELLCKVDHRGKILSASPSFLRVLGYHPHELEGRLLTDFVHSGDTVATHACLGELQRGEPIYRFENRWRDKAGSYHNISWDGTTPTAEGISYGGGLDVTQKKRREAEREEGLAVEKRLMGIVSHDLRNPLTTIGMAAQLIERAPHKQDMVLRNAARILHSCRRAEALIHDILDFSQARHDGGIKVRVAPLNLTVLVQRVVDEVALIHPNRIIAVDAPDRAEVVADADKLGQLLSNLLTNGLKYGPAHEPIHVHVGQVAEQSTLEVRNGGPPIAPQLLPHLFEPFRRGHKDADAHHHSVGLGLYIVHEVARAHGGKVQVHSDAQSGTRFAVTLPNAGPKGPNAPPAGRPATAACGTQSVTSGGPNAASASVAAAVGPSQLGVSAAAPAPAAAAPNGAADPRVS